MFLVDKIIFVAAEKINNKLVNNFFCLLKQILIK